MTKSAGIFVKINYKLDSNDKNRIREKHAKYRESSLSKYLLCGGTFNKNGGTLIFQANDLREAEAIINNNPFSGANFYSFEILSRQSISLY